MEQYLIPIGLLFNSAVITFNRFVRKLPDWLYLSCLILGIILILTGAILRRKA